MPADLLGLFYDYIKYISDPLLLQPPLLHGARSQNHARTTTTPTRSSKSNTVGSPWNSNKLKTQTPVSSKREQKLRKALMLVRVERYQNSERIWPCLINCGLFLFVFSTSHGWLSLHVPYSSSLSNVATRSTLSWKQYSLMVGMIFPLSRIIQPDTQPEGITKGLKAQRRVWGVALASKFHRTLSNQESGGCARQTLGDVPDKLLSPHNLWKQVNDVPVVSDTPACFRALEASLPHWVMVGLAAKGGTNIRPGPW